MFGAKKNQEPTENTGVTETTPTTPKGYTPPKGSATPKRKVVEARNRRPVVASQAHLSKEEKRAQRAENRRKADETYRQQQEAMRTGNEAKMPYQHRGKVRSWGRDYVDASGPISAYFMPVALLLIPLIVLQNYFPKIAIIVTLTLYAVFFIFMFHAFYIASSARRFARAKFGVTAVPRGFLLQMVGRCFYPRRWRLPVAKVKRGEFPEGARAHDRKFLGFMNRKAKRNDA